MPAAAPPAPPPPAAPVLSPLSPSPVPAQFFGQRTPQAEVWRSGVDQPVQPSVRGRRFDQVRVDATDNEAFLVRFSLPLLTGGQLVRLQARSLSLAGANDLGALLVTTDAARQCVAQLWFPPGVGRGELVIQVEGVATTLRVVRSVPFPADSVAP